MEDLAMPAANQAESNNQGDEDPGAKSEQQTENDKKRGKCRNHPQPPQKCRPGLHHLPYTGLLGGGWSVDTPFLARFASMAFWAFMWLRYSSG